MNYTDISKYAALALATAALGTEAAKAQSTTPTGIQAGTIYARGANLGNTFSSSFTNGVSTMGVEGSLDKASLTGSFASNNIHIQSTTAVANGGGQDLQGASVKNVAAVACDLCSVTEAVGPSYYSAASIQGTVDNGLDVIKSSASTPATASLGEVYAPGLKATGDVATAAASLTGIQLGVGPSVGGSLSLAGAYAATTTRITGVSATNIGNITIPRATVAGDTATAVGVNEWNALSAQGYNVYLSDQGSVSLSKGNIKAPTPAPQ